MRAAAAPDETGDLRWLEQRGPAAPGRHRDRMTAEHAVGPGRSGARRDGGGPIKVGCCGFPRRLAEYAKALPVVEVQQTFYRMPRPQTAERWRAAVPAEFEFTLKAWQLITHPPASPTYRRLGREIPAAARPRYGSVAPTDEVREAWRETRAVARLLGATVVVFQCPASFAPTREHVANLRRFFRDAEREEFRFVWEPRGGWPADLIEGLCRELDLVHCVDPFADRSAYGTPRYYRLHGRRGFRYRYTDDDLRALRGWCQAPAYVLFNNVAMWEDALRFVHELAR